MNIEDFHDSGDSMVHARIEEDGGQLEPDETNSYIEDVDAPVETAENKEVKENIVPNADWTIGALIDKMAKNSSRMAGKRITEKAEWL